MTGQNGQGAGALVLTAQQEMRDWWAMGWPLTVLATACLVLMACQPTVKIEAPDKPIEINLNVRIEQEVRIKVDRELDDLLASNPDLF